MGNEDTLLLRKSNTTSTVKDTMEEWNIACTDVPFEPGGKMKDLPTQDWADEDGEDTYIPDTLPMSAYDLEIAFCYKGELETAYSQIKAFTEYLSGEDGDGAELMIYCPHTGIGRQSCYMKEVSDFDFWNRNGEDILEFSVTFRVTDPKTQITLSAV